MKDRNQQQRLEKQRDSLQAQWDLTNKKLTQLRLAFAKEAGVAVKFQLEQEIQAEETELKRLEQELDTIEQAILTPDGKYVISASGDSTLNVWNWQTGEVIASFIGESSINCCAVASDGVGVVAGDLSGRVHFFRLQGTKE